jgi:hypothetical protein
MLTLTGTLRQHGELTIKEKPFAKLWVEHESERENGVNDLQILELLLPIENVGKLPAKGSPVSVDVRCYAMGRDIRFSAIAVRSVALTPEKTVKALETASSGK